MEKKILQKICNKEFLVAKAQDKMQNFMLANQQIRGSIISSTLLVREIMENHNYGILETYILGQFAQGALLMSSNLKGKDRLSIILDTSSQMKGLIVEANGFGECRGFIKTTPIKIDKPLESFDLEPFIKDGFIEVQKLLENAKTPFASRVNWIKGSIANNLANYYQTSEQLPTAFNLSVKFKNDGSIEGAGGLLLQAMPDADSNLLAELETVVQKMPSIGKEFAKGITPQAFIEEHFKKYKPEFSTNNYRVEFFCHCSKDKMLEVLKTLSKEDYKDLTENGDFPLEMRCQWCSSFYNLEKEDLLKTK